MADISDSQWVTIFQDQAEQLLNTTSEELGALKETNKDEFEKTMDSIVFKNFNFKLRCKIETYNVSVDTFFICLCVCVCMYLFTQL